MKRILIFTCVLLMTCVTFSQEKDASEKTTYYFIRHAEKDRSNPSEKNPHLMAKGLERAERWSDIFANITFNAVYTTDYYRTKETAQPTADRNNLDLIVYNPETLNILSFLNDTKGKTVLVVGHSNTIPAFVNKVIGVGTYENIEDDNNGNMYIVTIIDGKIAYQVLTIN